jgi:4-hydroxy-tetrahydrodipicolinate synthase
MQAPVTPFTADGRVDFETYEKLINFHIHQGTSGLCVVLHVAESLNLTIQERKTLVEVSVKVAKGQVPVVANVSLPGTDQAIDLARHAEKVGADAVCSTPSYYWRPPEEAIFEHFVALGSAIGIPFMAYNSPLAQGGISLSPKVLVRLLERLNNFVGLKEASHSFEYFIEARRATQAVRPEFGLLVGVEYLLPSMVLGGAGCMSVFGAVAPNLVRDLSHACVAKDYDRALNLQDKASHLVQLFKVEYPASIKAAMEIMGRPVGTTRLPIRWLSEEDKRRLRVELEALGILDQEPHGW